MKQNRSSTGTGRAQKADQLLSVARGIFSKPIRVKMMRWLCSHAPATQREIGKALLRSSAAIHYHLKWLQAREVVALHATRPGPNGITEKLYQVNWKVWDPVKHAAGKEGACDFMLDYTLDGIQEFQRVGAHLIKADPSNRFIAVSFGVFAPPREIHQLKQHIDALLGSFRQKHAHSAQRKGWPVSVSFSILPSTAENLQGVKTLDMLMSQRELEKLSGTKISAIKLSPKTQEKILALGDC